MMFRRYRDVADEPIAELGRSFAIKKVLSFHSNAQTKSREMTNSDLLITSKLSIEAFGNVSDVVLVMLSTIQ